MPKMKTNSSAKKRFKVTGTGKIKQFRTGKRHLLRKKSTKAKRHLLGSAVVEGGDAVRVKRLLCL